MRKRTGILLCAWLTLTASVFPLLAERESEKENEAEEVATVQSSTNSPLPGLPAATHSSGYISIGAKLNNLDGSQVRVSEYEAIQQGTRPTGRIGFWGAQDGFVWDLEGSRGVNPADQDYRLGIDMKRYWKSNFQLTRLPHRLVNDPLTNLDAAKGGPMVRHTSNDMGVDYRLTYQDLEWKNEVIIPALPLVKVHFDYRNQIRNGAHQGRTMSKCSSCHVVSNVREIDREVEEIRTGLTVGNHRAAIEYQFLHRALKERAGTPTHLYDVVEHPVLQKPVFSARTQFDKSDGPLPYNQIPRFKKQRHLVRGRLQIPKGGGQVVGTFVNDHSDNDSALYGVTSQVASGHYALKVGERFRLSIRARNQEMDSDTLFVDVVTPEAIAGPNAGKTFPEAYPAVGDLDFTKRSLLERDIFDFQVDARYLVTPKSIFRLGYEFSDLERPNYEVHRTKTNRFRFGFTAEAAEGLKARLRYIYSHSDEPFMHSGAALPPVLQPFPSPGSSPFAGTQYFTIYDARVANLTAFPEETHEFDSSLTWSPSSRMGLSAHLRVDSGQYLRLNDPTSWDASIGINDFGDWHELAVSPSVELWLAPVDRVDLLASYAFHQRETESLFGIAVYDG